MRVFDDNELTFHHFHLRRQPTNGIVILNTMAHLNHTTETCPITHALVVHCSWNLGTATIFYLKKVKECASYLWKSISQLRSVTCRMGSHTVTYHPTQANTPRLYPSQTGWYSIYRPFKDGGLSKPRLRVHRATGSRLLHDSPGQRDLNPQSIDR